MATQDARKLFVADVHLEMGGGERTDRFCRFLAETCRPDDEVYALGDLFDLWLGPGHESAPDYTGVLGAMRSAVGRGVRLRVLPGNRDFLMGQEFVAASGAELLPESADLQVAGQRCLMCHGDQFNTGDRLYRVYRRLLHSRAIRFAADTLPMRVKRLVAGPLRRRTIRIQNISPEKDILPPEDELQQCFAEGYDVVICGHFHRSREIDTGRGRLFVLDNWARSADVLLHHSGGWERLIAPQ